MQDARFPFGRSLVFYRKGYTCPQLTKTEDARHSQDDKWKGLEVRPILTGIHKLKMDGTVLSTSPDASDSAESRDCAWVA